MTRWILLVSIAFAAHAPAEPAWPELPERDGEVMIPAQEWPRQPGERQVKVYIRYPGGSVDGVNAETGLMLTLHNWGGTGWDGTADPATVAARYDVVAIAVDYLQSGKWDPANGLPYDFGLYQATDALRALWFVYNALFQRSIPFSHDRIFAAGGSGGGNVALMCNKLAPRTFACVVDMSGMARLSDAFAFGFPGRSEPNAGYSRDPNSPNFLTEPERLIRDLGEPSHLVKMKQLGNSARIVIVHGENDAISPTPDKRALARALSDAQFDVAAHFVGPRDIDGVIIKGTGHSDIGDRGELVHRFAGRFLGPRGRNAVVRSGKTDFECRDTQVRYVCAGTTFIVDYTAGYPVLRVQL